MAKSAGRTTGAPSRSRRSPAGGKNNNPAKRKPNPLVTEVKYLTAAALGILLLLSMYIEGAAGFIGRFLQGLFTGLFGFGAYALPFAVIAVSVYALFSRTKRFAPMAFTLAAIFGWCVIALLHLAAVKELPDYPGVFAYFQAAYADGSMKNGGLMGALLGNLLRTLLGSAGAFIVLIAGGLITLVLWTGRSLTHTVAFIVEKFRSLAEGMAYTDEDTDEDTDEEPDQPSALQLPPRKTQELKPLPPKPNRKKKEAPKPALFVIDDRAEREPKRVMLVHEDLEADPLPRPAQAPQMAQAVQAVQTVQPDLPLRRPKPAPLPPEGPAEIIELGDITVKGMVDEAEPPEEPGELYDEVSVFEEEPPVSSGIATPLPVLKAVPAPSRPKTETPRLSAAQPRYENYQYPPITLLTKNQTVNTTGSRTQILENSRILEETLKSFRVEAKVTEVSVGPTVTRYDLAPGPGVKVSSIANLSNDLALSLAAQGIRIEAPIPGKAAVGIEIPNKDPQPVLLREIIEDDAFAKFPSRLAFAVGKDIAGSAVVTDVARMPHLLIAGATGSGKSVCINTLITSLLYKSRPDEVKLLMIDPKVVELSVYNGIPHLLIPVVTDPKKASGALQWAVTEMDNRYALFAEAGVRDLKGYNTYKAEDEEDDTELPQIVIIIDELADLMMVCKGDVEESICRLAQKARAAGIHLIVATQRPSVDVITGLIKANIPSRLAFAVSSGIDSRTVLDSYGAEKLLGKGDMLFLPMGRNKPLRLQGGFVSDKEVENVVDFLKQHTVTEYPDEMIEKVTSAGRADLGDEDLDEFFRDAVEFLLEKGKASTSMLQRQFRIGYNRASRLMEDLEDRGIVGPEDGVKPRKIMITREEFYNGSY